MDTPNTHNFTTNALVITLVFLGRITGEFGNLMFMMAFDPQLLAYVIQNVTYLAALSLSILNIYRFFIPKKRAKKKED